MKEWIEATEAAVQTAREEESEMITDMSAARLDNKDVCEKETDLSAVATRNLQVRMSSDCHVGAMYFCTNLEFPARWCSDNA